MAAPGENKLLHARGRGFPQHPRLLKGPREVVPEWGEVQAKVAAETLPLFEHRLGESEWLTDHGFSVADITLAITLEFARRTQQTLPYDLPQITRWFDAVQARPSWQAD